LYYSDFSLVQDLLQIYFYSVQHESFPIIQRNDVLMLFIQIGHWYAKQPTYRNRQTLSHNVLSSTPRHEQGSKSQL
jgi:trehalose utilization protein